MSLFSGENPVLGPLTTIEGKKILTEGESNPVTSNDITDATTVGKQVLTAASPAAALTAIGGSSLGLSTTAPVALAAVAAVGTGTTAARTDHVHPIPGASSGTTRGTVLIQAAIANLTADPTLADFNGLLAALRSAGILAT